MNTQILMFLLLFFCPSIESVIGIYKVMAYSSESIFIDCNSILLLVRNDDRINEMLERFLDYNNMKKQNS